MRLFRLSFRRVLLLGALLLVAAGIIAPYLHANRFMQRIGQALEESLNRKVDIEDVRFNLFRGPGFSLRKVVIQEDPAMDNRINVTRASLTGVCASAGRNRRAYEAERATPGSAPVMKSENRACWLPTTPHARRKMIRPNTV